MQQIKITGQELKTINYTDKHTGEAKSFDKYVINSGKTNYEFSTHKKDGSPTKAYEYIKQFKPAIGEIINAEVKEEETSFKGKDGNMVAFTRRTIMYFETVEDLPVINREETVEIPPLEAVEELVEEASEITKTANSLSKEPTPEELNELLGE